MDYAAGIQPRFPSQSRACFQASELRPWSFTPDWNSCPGERWTQSSPLYKGVTLFISQKGLSCCLQPEAMAKLRSAEDSALSHFLDVTQQNNLAEVLKEITFVNIL